MRFREDFGFGSKRILNRKGKPKLGIGKAEILDREFAPRISASRERNINMTAGIQPLNTRSAWKALEAHYPKVKNLHLRQLFADDPRRGERLTAEAVGVYLDYSKNRITEETLKLLLQLAEESGLQARIDAMFAGKKINTTENRAVLHVVLRAPKGASITVDGEDVVPQVHAVLDKMAGFADHVLSGKWKGHTGKRIKNVINIGIGRSDLRVEIDGDREC
jgi:glucose-6-phosphate isomerase